MASSSINTYKITGFEIHTTNIRNPHKSASFISIHLAKTEFLHSKLPRPLELKTFPWLGQLQKHACWLMWLIFKKTPKSLCVCTKCALPIPNSVRFENNSCKQTVFPPTQKCQEVSALLHANWKYLFVPQFHRGNWKIIGEIFIAYLNYRCFAIVSVPIAIHQYQV